MATLLQRFEHDRQEIDRGDAKIERLNFEMAQLKRAKSGIQREHLDAGRSALYDESVDADMAALEAQFEALLRHRRSRVSQPKKATGRRTGCSSGR